jgi:hypothetical protein
MDPFTATLLVIGALSGTASAVTSMQAAKSQKKAQTEQRNQQNMRAAMERRQTIRQTRMAYATAMQNAENQGVGTSSGAAGGQGSILTQGNANLSFLDDNMMSANKQGSLLDKAAGQQAMAGMWGSLSQLAMTAAGSVPGATTPDAKIPGKPSGANPYMTLGKGLQNNGGLQLLGYNMGVRPIY